jgi:hypothetical protein
MSDLINTIKVKPWGEGQGDFVEINADDFDAKVHKKLTDAEIAKIEAAAETPAA